LLNLTLIAMLFLLLNTILVATLFLLLDLTLVATLFLLLNLILAKIFTISLLCKNLNKIKFFSLLKLLLQAIFAI